MSTTPWLLHRVPEAEPAEVETVSYAQARRTLERLVRFGQGDGREQMEQMQRDRSAVAPLEQRISQSALGAARLTEMPTSEISRDSSTVWNVSCKPLVNWRAISWSVSKRSNGRNSPRPCSESAGMQ